MDSVWGILALAPITLGAISFCLRIYIWWLDRKTRIQKAEAEEWTRKLKEEQK